KISLHVTAMTLERVDFQVHTGRRVIVPVEGAFTRKPPVPFGGWLPVWIPVLYQANDLIHHSSGFLIVFLSTYTYFPIPRARRTRGPSKSLMVPRNLLPVT